MKLIEPHLVQNSGGKQIENVKIVFVEKVIESTRESLPAKKSYLENK